MATPSLVSRRAEARQESFSKFILFSRSILPPQIVWPAGSYIWIGPFQEYTFRI
jgi:hypothetical protein